MIVVYGSPHNRGFRTLWMLEELGLPYENVELATRQGETRTPQFLAINPNGHVPTLVDGDTVVWESMAINLYLANRYDGGLAPRGVPEQAAVTQWSFWVVTEVEETLLSYGMHRLFLPEPERDAAVAQTALEKLEAALAVLDAALDRVAYLVGDRFTVADLNVASVLSWVSLVQLDISKYANVRRWLDACLARPAAGIHQEPPT